MTTVFLGGSRRVSKINSAVQRRLDNIINNNFRIVIGDANGADKSIQQYLFARNYSNVEVFCTDGICRNNVGNWRVRAVPSKSKVRDFSFYASKDREMSKEATIGMMIWDGKSIGTLVNTFRLLTDEKKVVIYVMPEKRFSELRSFDEWADFIVNYDRALKQKVMEKTTLEANENKSWSQQRRLAL